MFDSEERIGEQLPASFLGFFLFHRPLSFLFQFVPISQCSSLVGAVGFTASVDPSLSIDPFS